MSTKTSGLSKFSVRPLDAIPSTAGAAPDLEQISAGARKSARGTKARVGIAVRLGHEDWHRLHELAMREHSSLQGLIMSGLGELMKIRGLPPLSGG